MGVYSIESVRGGDKDFFPGKLGRIRNFGKKCIFISDNLPILGGFGEILSLSGGKFFASSEK